MQTWQGDICGHVYDIFPTAGIFGEQCEDAN